jgi:hypothetical protein
MRRSSLVVSVALLAACTIWLTGLAQAQFRASIRGTVTDTSSAAIPGATVTLVNTDTNQTLVSTSDANGIYQFNALPTAPYRLTAEAKGFKKKVLDHVQIIPDQPNGLDVQLEVGDVQQTIIVSATTQALDTETATVSGTVSNNQIQHMPSFGRDVMKLAQLAPGVFGDGSQGSAGGGFDLPGTETGGGASGGDQGIFNTENGVPVSANGGQSPSNGVTVDGISTSSAVWGGTTVITPSEDSIDNVKIVSNSYDAENGRFSGAQIQITSKGGSNQFHGSAFFTAHRPGLNAYQRYNGDGNQPLRDPSLFNQYGGSLGGPIWKNKIFAFFNYETIREHTDITTNQWGETAAFDALAPPGSIAATMVGFPGNGIVNKGINNSTCASAGLTEGVNCVTLPGAGLDVGSPLTTGLGTQDLGWTDPQHPGVGGGLDGVADITNYIVSNPTSLSEVQYNGRLDANLTEKDRIAFAIYWVPITKNNNNGNRALDVFHHNQINNAFSAIWNRTFSPTLLNEFRVNAAGWRWNELASNPQSPIGLPPDNIDGFGSITMNPFGPSVGSELDQWTYGFKDVATKIIGRHTVKVGGDVTRLFYLNQCVGCGIPGYNFFNMWDFLNDAPHTEGYTTFDPHTGLPTTLRQDDRENILGFFAQDDFKLRKNLTLNLGLRWSYFGPLSSKENNMYIAVPGAGSDYLTGLTVQRGNSWNAQKNNFSPEIGFAWSPTQFHDKLVVRGGYGLNYNQEEIAISANVQGNPGLSIGEFVNMNTPTSPNPGIIYAVSSDPHNLNGYPPNPNFVLDFGPNGLPTNGAVGVVVLPRTLPTMRVHHYSLDTQYDLGHNLIASLGYQGSLSRDLLFHESPLAVPATLGYSLNPQINGGDFWSASGRGNYNAMLAELKHDFSHQFMADAQFTWAKSMDNTSRPYTEPYYPYDPSLSYGRSDYSVGKAFKVFGMWQPVLFHGNNSWMEKIAGGWSLSGIFNIHSGFPWSPVVSVQGGSLYCGQCGYTNVLPAAYLGGAGSSTSNDAFKTEANSNFPKGTNPLTPGGTAYFSTPTYTAYNCDTCFGTALPQSPGARRNSLNLPGYKDVDLTLAKGFGLPNTSVLGENAKLEFRIDAYNVFNNLNFDPTLISNNIGNSNFGTISGALAARVVTLGLRFSF